MAGFDTTTKHSIEGGPRDWLTLAGLPAPAAADAELDGRVLLDNVLARWRHRRPVRSVAYLLRPAAVTRPLLGGVRERLDAVDRLEFDYRPVRVWELPAEPSWPAGSVRCRWPR